jgi:hypothetical protein
MTSHHDALKAFGRKLSLLLMLRGAVQWSTAWFFIWGAVVLAARLAHLAELPWLSLGLLGAVPLAAIAAAREYRRRFALSPVRAVYDELNRCGGIIMASENADLTAWENTLPRPSGPVLRWRAGRIMGMFTLSVVFVAVALLLPERMTMMAGSKPLQIGQLVSELKAEVETLKEEKILEPEKAEDTQKQLERLQEKSSAVDPNKTWEALDHIKESNSDLARQAAEEALTKTKSLTEAETLARALEMASDMGLGQDTATRFAQDLASMLKAAKLEEGLLNASIPPELLSQLENMNRSDLNKLLSAIQFKKNTLGKTITNLAKLKFIDVKSLSQCKNAGICPNPLALAAFLCENTNASCCNAVISYCRGGVTRGRGDAPMTWKDESTEQGTKFNEQVLPSSDRLSDAQFVGVSRTAPELSGDEVVAGHGALGSAAASGGSAHSQVILPRHKQAVQRFFNRQE